MKTTIKDILKSCGIVAAVVLLAFAFFKPMEWNMEARTVAKDGKMYDILPKLPKEKAEKEDENQVSIATLGSGGGYYMADANYTAPPNSHFQETTDANEQAWEQAKKDDEAAENAENAKDEVAEKPLEIVKTPELEKEDEEKNKPVIIEVNDDGSINVTDKENAGEDTDTDTDIGSGSDTNVDKTDDIVVSVDEEGGLTVTDKNDAEQPPVETPTEDDREIIDIGTIPFDDGTSGEVPEDSNTSTDVEETQQVTASQPDPVPEVVEPVPVQEIVEPEPVPVEPEPTPEIVQETTETTVQPEVLEEEVVEQPMEVIEVVVEW